MLKQRFPCLPFSLNKVDRSILAQTIVNTNTIYEVSPPDQQQQQQLAKQQLNQLVESETPTAAASIATANNINNIPVIEAKTAFEMINLEQPALTKFDHLWKLLEDDEEYAQSLETLIEVKN